MKLSDEISTKLINWCRGTGYEIVIPNYYVGAYEMDVFRLMPSGLVIEYEIKVSRSDLKADLKKGYTTGWNENKVHHLKHEEMKAGKRKCNRFFFVVPKDLIKENECPNHCGLIYYDSGSFDVIKNAPYLHKEKVKIEEYKTISTGLAFREQRLRSNMNFYKWKMEEKESIIKNLTAQLTK